MAPASAQSLEPAMVAAIQRVAAALHREGIAEGDRVLLMMETRYEWLICDLAILACGALTVPTYPNLPAKQINHPLADAKPRAAIVSRPELLNRLLRAPEAAERLSVIFLLEGEPPPMASVRVNLLRPILDAALGE